jgi:hypothetical protein
MIFCEKDGELRIKSRKNTLEKTPIFVKIMSRM